MRFSKEQWKGFVAGAIVSVIVGDLFRWIIRRIWEGWDGLLELFGDPSVQIWFAQLIVPIVMLVIFFRHYRVGLEHGDQVAKILFCGMSGAFLIVFALNLGRPQIIPMIEKMQRDPLSALPVFFIAAFYLFLSAVRTIKTGDGVPLREENVR